MLRVLAFVLNEHDYRLVLLAGLVCAATSLTSFQAYACATRDQGSRRLAWVFLTALAAATGIWAAHFIAMLAYDPGRSDYDAVLTIVSLLVCAAATMAGFAVAARGTRSMAAIGGAIIGGGIVLAHFAGMQALAVPGTLVWNGPLVVSAIAIGVGLAIAALLAWHDLERRKAIWLAAGLLTLAVYGLHFTATAAVTIAHDPAIVVPARSVDSPALAMVVTAATVLVMLSVLAIRLIDSARLEEQNALLEQHREDLEARNASLDAALRELKAQKSDLDLALANMSQGLAMFDADERLVLANDRYAEIYGLEPEHLQPGMKLRELIEYRIAKGLYQGLTADDVLQNMRKRVARNKANFLTSRPGDGSVLSVAVHPRAEGGWVVTLQDITEREQLHARLLAQNALLQQREEERAAQNVRFDAAISNMSQGMCLYDAQQRIVFANERYAELYGLDPEHVRPGTSLSEVFQARIASGAYGASDTEALVREATARFSKATKEITRLSDGRFISIVRKPLPDGGLLCTHEDITEREKLSARLARQNELLTQREQELNARNQQLDLAMNNMLQGLAMFDERLRLVMCNKRYAEMYGLTPEQVRPGVSMRSLIEHRIARGDYRGKSSDELIRDMLERTAGQRVTHYTTELSDGRHVAVSVQPMVGGGTVTTHHDITEQRRSEAKIAHMALHDTLTGLPNRVLLNQRLEDALLRVKRSEMLATHLLDLDNFKAVNDTLGHPAGDRLLGLVADRLRKVVRETDTIARMGGDEFAIVQVAIMQPAEATALAHRIIETVRAPFDLDGTQVVIGTSVGIAVGPADGTSPDRLIRNADLALYRAKSDGRGTYRFFEREMDAQMQVRRVLEQDLRKALAAGEFELHYQPVVNLASNDVSGFEALIRWRHPERGMVPPATFIPVAEEIGLISVLGEWAIRQACAAAVKWPDGIRVAVNLSPAQFRTPGLVQVVVSALAATGLSAEQLELEITEGTLLQDSEATLSTLYQLRALGVRIAMDDFGTGYSSLSYLQSFPFDKIKIDRSFVKDITDGVGSLNIVRAVAAMANGLGMTTTAEGVETVEQMETVRAEGCTEMQGFLFSKPLPVEEIEPFLLSRRKENAGDGGERKGDAAADAA